MSTQQNEWETPEWTFGIEIVGAFALWACRQSPYGVPDGLEQACKSLRDQLPAHIILDANGMARMSLKQISDALHAILPTIPEFASWCQPKDRTTEFIFVTAFSKPPADRDCIDEEALIKNVCYAILEEHRRHRRGLETSTCVTGLVVGCARCGETHERVRFTRLLRPVIRGGDEKEVKEVLYTHFAPCPTNGHPIMLLIKED